MITATCPACRVLLVEARTTDLTDVAVAVSTAARLGATFVSNSYGASDTGSTSHASSFAAPGVAYVASIGDDGYGNGAPAFPATAPGVLAVGGTSLRPASSARGWSGDRVGRGRAGHGVLDHVRQARRPDRARHRLRRPGGRRRLRGRRPEDRRRGLQQLPGGGWVRVFGGTSASAPIVAGIAALANQPGPPEAAAYASPAAFHDVTSGSTGSCGGSVACNAGAGWDGPTGLGTPAGTGGFATSPVSCGGTPAGVTDTSGSAATGRYVPVTPVRVLDTRSDAPSLGPAGTRTVDLRVAAAGGPGLGRGPQRHRHQPHRVGVRHRVPGGYGAAAASSLNTVPGLTRANRSPSRSGRSARRAR